MRERILASAAAYLPFAICYSLLLLPAPPAAAQVAGMVSFQGVLKDSGGNALQGSVTLDFRIFDAPTAGALVDMDGDGSVENTVGEDVKRVITPAVTGVVSTQFGPVSPSVLNGQQRFIEVTIVSPTPITALSRVPMTTAPAVAEQLYARGTTNVAVSTDAGGNVGIGTDANTPYFSARLHVNNGQFAVSEPYQDQYVGVFIKGNYNGTGRAAIGSTSSGPARGPFSLVTADGERLTIDTAGNVGIGTTNPQTKLHVSGPSLPSHVGGTLGSLAIDAPYSPEGAYTTLDFASNHADVPAARISAFHSNAGSRLHFGTSNNFGMGVTNDALVIAENGNVGIGTTAPAAPLHIRSPGFAIICQSNSAGSSSDLYWVDQDDDPSQTYKWNFSYRGNTSGDHLILRRNGGSIVMHFRNDSGDVAIGRVSSGMARFEVEGNAGKTVGGGSWVTLSDRRIKSDILTVRDGLATLDRLRVTSFRYSDDYRATHPSIENRRYLNVIAQEFAEVFPDHVRSSGEKLPPGQGTGNGEQRTDGGDEILQVDPWPLTIYSVAAIQELHQIVKHKDAQLTAAEARIDELSTRLERLEKLLAGSNEKGR